MPSTELVGKVLPGFSRVPARASVNEILRSCTTLAGSVDVSTKAKSSSVFQDKPPTNNLFPARASEARATTTARPAIIIGCERVMSRFPVRGDAEVSRCGLNPAGFGHTPQRNDQTPIPVPRRGSVRATLFCQRLLLHKVAIARNKTRAHSGIVAYRPPSLLEQVPSEIGLGVGMQQICLARMGP